MITETIWIELVTFPKHTLFGVFYRPPDTAANIHAAIENSIHLAVDMGITNIIRTGDFNTNFQDPNNKLKQLCNQCGLYPNHQ